MRTFQLFSFLVVAVVARPEPPVQYSNSNNGFSSYPAPTYGAPEVAPSPDTIAPADSDIVRMPETPAQEDSYNAAYRHSSSSQYQSGYDNGPQETQVHKHIYVHVPPKDFEEEEAMQPRVTHQMVPKQKHYKIVFIKAPIAPAIRPPVVAPPPQNEEKTLIYVLHKKPESQPDIVIPAPAPTKPSKPEVFFIKYKTKKEEAPVYGPPPATYNSEPRQAADSAEEYNAPSSNDINDFAPMDLSQYEQQATIAPSTAEEAQPQLISTEQAPETYDAPTVSNFIGDEIQTPAEPEPSNQYLAPETTSAPIVVAEPEEEPRTPAATYGAPSRYYIKRRK